MKTNLILISLILSAVSNSVLGVKLKKICKEDAFQYENCQINSVHLIKRHVDLRSLKALGIGELYVSAFFVDEATGNKMEEYYEANDRLMKTLYSKRFLNQKNLSSQSFNQIKNTAEKLHSKVQQSLSGRVMEDDEYLIGSIRYMVNTTIHLIDFISSFYDYKLPQQKSTVYDQFLEGDFIDLELILDSLKVGDNQKFAFADHSITEIKKKQIIGWPKFDLLKNSKPFIEAIGRLKFTIVLPFEDLNYYQNLSNSTCIKAADLPKFYQNKF